MTEPQRLFLSPEVSPALQEELRLAQNEEPYDTAKGLARFAQATLVLETANLAHQSASSVASGSSAANAGTSKGLAIGLSHGTFWGLGVAGIAGALLLIRGHVDPPSNAAWANESERGTQSIAHVEQRPLVEELGKAAPVETDNETPDFELSRTTKKHFALEELRPKRTHQPAASPGEKNIDIVEASSSGNLTEEVKELRLLRSLLLSAPEQALSGARTSSFSRGGILGPERNAVMIDALIKLERTTEARQEAGAFVIRYPNAPAARRMRQLAASLPLH